MKKREWQRFVLTFAATVAVAVIPAVLNKCAGLQVPPIQPPPPPGARP